MEGHYIIGYGDGSEEPGKELQPSQGAIEKAEQFMEQHQKSHERYARVERLIEGFETAFGMELLGSVHWVAMYELKPARNSSDAAELIHAWNPRKRQFFSAEHVATAWQRLSEHGWLQQ